MKRRKHRTGLWLGLGLALIAGALFLSEACAKKGKDASDKAHLSIGVMPSVDYLPIAIAEQQGFFSMPIEIVRFASPMERDAALQTGAVDASVTDYMGAMLLHSKGLEVSLPIACQGSFRLVFGRDKDLDQVADLRGKRVGLSSNTLIDYATERSLVDAHSKPFAYTRVEVQKIPIRLEMLRSGELDAAILPEPFATIGESKGLVAIDVPRGLTVGITGLLFQRSALTSKEKAVRSFVSGYNQAIDYMQSHPRSEWAGALEKLLGVPKELAMRIPLPTYTKVTAPQAEDLTPILDWMKEKGLVPPTYTAEGLITALPEQ